MARAKFWIGMRNLMYNMNRFVSLKRAKAAKQALRRFPQGCGVHADAGREVGAAPRAGGSRGPD